MSAIWEAEYQDATGLVLVCQGCGGDRLVAAGTRRGRLILQCATCRAEIEIIGADARTPDGEMHMAEDMPDRLRAIGQDRSDPWVPLRIRMKRSARDKIQEAARRVREIHDKPRGPLTIGWALEMICADFLAGAGWGDEG